MYIIILNARLIPADVPLLVTGNYFTFGNALFCCFSELSGYYLNVGFLFEIIRLTDYMQEMF